MEHGRIGEVWHLVDPAALEALRRELDRAYPSLHVRQEGNTVFVHGTFPLMHDGKVLTRYRVEIELPPNYPHWPPRIWEVGRRIPRLTRRHVNVADGSLCIGVLPELWIQCQGDFSLCRYLSGPVRAYLIGNSLVESGHDWPNGEWPHGISGVFAYYGGAIDSEEERAVLVLLSYLVRPKIKGHWDCPCGSGEKLRKCHGERVWSMHGILPASVVYESIALIRRLRAGRLS